MSAIDVAVVRLQSEEGFRANVYDDATGVPLSYTGQPTIGYGCRCLQWSQALALAVLTFQAGEVDSMLRVYPWYVAIGDLTRQGALIDMAFNLGVSGLVNGFPKMIAAIKADDWAGAAAQAHVTIPTLDNGRYASIRQALLLGGTE